MKWNNIYLISQFPSKYQEILTMPHKIYSLQNSNSLKDLISDFSHILVKQTSEWNLLSKLETQCYTWLEYNCTFLTLSERNVFYPIFLQKSRVEFLTQQLKAMDGFIINFQFSLKKGIFVLKSLIFLIPMLLSREISVSFSPISR